MADQKSFSQIQCLTMYNILKNFDSKTHYSYFRSYLTCCRIKDLVETRSFLIYIHVTYHEMTWLICAYKHKFKYKRNSVIDLFTDSDAILNFSPVNFCVK